MSEVFSFEESQFLGTVRSVDTNDIHILVENSELMSRVSVGSIIGLKSSYDYEVLIGLVDRVTRTNEESIIFDDEDSGEVVDSPVDLVRVNLIGNFKSVYGEKRNIFKRGVDSFPQIGKECYFIEGQNLKNFMSILGSNVEESERLKIGNFIIDKSADAILDGDKLFQRHASVLGSTGSGKSWCVATILEKASALKYPNLIVLDMHGEYSDLCKGSNKIAESYKIAGPADTGNLSNGIIHLPYWLLNREEMLSMFLDRSDQNAPNQSSRFTLHVRTLKEKMLEENGKDDVMNSFTVDSPIPYKLADLVAELKADDTRKSVGTSGKDVKGDWEGKLTRFVSRLENKIEDKRYSFLFSPPDDSNSYEWLSQLVEKLLGYTANDKTIKIIDFSEVPSDILPVITGTLARLLYDVQFWMKEENRTPYTLVCDEAHLYLPTKDDSTAVQKQALYNFERIAKEGRKYGVSLMVVSQRPSDVSKTILSQCNNFIVLRLTNENDKSLIKHLIPDSLKGLIDTLSMLDVGEALIIGDSILLPSRIVLDQPSIKPKSATRAFWQEWNDICPDNQALILAVESLRKQSKN